MQILTQNFKKYKYGLLCLLCITIHFPISVQAHRLIVKAYTNGDSIYAQGRTEDGSACRHSAALLQNSKGETLAQSVTNSNGQCAFPVQQETNLKVVIFGDMGHRGESAVIELPKTDQATNHHSQNDMAQIMDQKLAPLIAAIEHLQHEQEHANVRDIIGGIGYIIGLVGMGLYFSSKKKT